MHVHLWHGIFGRATNIEISLAGERRMDAALHADFRAAAFRGFAHAAADFVVVDEVGFAAQVLVRATLRECAAAALVQADVRVVDVANDSVARTSVAWGKSVSVGVDPGGRRPIKKKKTTIN